ncbi:MAG: hypothetical protein HW405_948 [Candidatus Berkelbacteria bacterium]|nr:hypothetical protein [Candidatus Berkelbacteria bacterium]
MTSPRTPVPRVRSLPPSSQVRGSACQRPAETRPISACRPRSPSGTPRCHQRPRVGMPEPEVR